MTEETTEPIVDEDEDGCLDGHEDGIEKETQDEDLPAAEGGVA